MASIFKNKFLSKAGQKERLKNAADVIKSAFDFNKNTKVVANIKNKPLKKVTEAIANNPYTAAAVAAGGVVGGKALLGSGAKTAAGAASAAKASAAASSKSLLGGGLRKALPYGAAALGGAFLFRGSSPDVNPEQISNPFQALDAAQGGQRVEAPRFPIDAGETGSYINGNENFIDQRKQIYTHSYSLNKAANVPQQVLTPQLHNLPSQTAEATAQTDWLPLALIGGAVLLFK